MNRTQKEGERVRAPLVTYLLMMMFSPFCRILFFDNLPSPPLVILPGVTVWDFNLISTPLSSIHYEQQQQIALWSDGCCHCHFCILPYRVGGWMTFLLNYLISCVVN